MKWECAFLQRTFLTSWTYIALCAVIYATHQQHLKPKLLQPKEKIETFLVTIKQNQVLFPTDLDKWGVRPFLKKCNFPFPISQSG